MKHASIIHKISEFYWIIELRVSVQTYDHGFCKTPKKRKCLEFDIAPCFTGRAFETFLQHSPVVLHKLALDVTWKHIWSPTGRAYQYVGKRKIRFDQDKINKVVCCRKELVWQLIIRVDVYCQFSWLEDRSWQIICSIAKLISYSVSIRVFDCSERRLSDQLILRCACAM
jgi:hypothetical protein